MWSKEEHYHELKLFLLLESAFKLLCGSLEMKIKGMKLYMQTVLPFSDEKGGICLKTFSDITRTYYYLKRSLLFVRTCTKISATIVLLTPGIKSVQYKFKYGCIAVTLKFKKCFTSKVVSKKTIPSHNPICLKINVISSLFFIETYL